MPLFYTKFQLIFQLVSKTGKLSEIDLFPQLLNKWKGLYQETYAV